MKFSVHLLTDDGQGSYLQVKNKTAWSKPTAIKHAKDVHTLIVKGKNIFNAVEVWVENEYGEIVKEFK
jgi:hypothetical protein